MGMPYQTLIITIDSRTENLSTRMRLSFAASLIFSFPYLIPTTADAAFRTNNTFLTADIFQPAFILIAICSIESEWAKNF